jgi:hypothetical protein
MVPKEVEDTRLILEADRIYSILLDTAGGS